MLYRQRRWITSTGWRKPPPVATSKPSQVHRDRLRTGPATLRGPGRPTKRRRPGPRSPPQSGTRPPRLPRRCQRQNLAARHHPSHLPRRTPIPLPTSPPTPTPHRHRAELDPAQPTPSENLLVHGPARPTPARPKNRLRAHPNHRAQLSRGRPDLRLPNRHHPLPSGPSPSRPPTSPRRRRTTTPTRNPGRNPIPHEALACRPFGVPATSRPGWGCARQAVDFGGVSSPPRAARPATPTG